MAKDGNSSGGMNLHAGLKTKSPAGTDKSMSIPAGNTVNEGTRTGVAPTPKTIGDRCA